MSNPAEPTTAYTPRPWPFRQVKIEVTPDHVKNYFMANTSAMSALLDQLLIENPYTLSVFLDEHQEDFDEFVICGHAGGAV